MTNKTKVKLHSIYGDNFLTRKYEDVDFQQLVREENEFMLDTLYNLMWAEQIENYYFLDDASYVEDEEFNKFIDYWHFKNQSDVKGFFYFDTEEKSIKFYNQNTELLNTITF